MTKDELLAMLDDPDVRAKLLAKLPAAELAKSTPAESAPAFAGPAWLGPKAAGPHTQKRFSAPAK